MTNTEQKADSSGIVAKKYLIAILSLLFLASLLIATWVEVRRRHAEETGVPKVVVSGPSEACYNCHKEKTPGIVTHWEGSKHASLGIGCLECHRANEGEADAWKHEGSWIATVVTPKDCSACHADIYKEFEQSHHAKGGNILASLDNLLAEQVEGFRSDHGKEVMVANPHNPGEMIAVNGLAVANLGCQQCHGAKLALLTDDPRLMVTVDNVGTVPAEKIKRDKNGKPLYDSRTWPNTGIGRMNLDGSLGSCSACHSRHDFSARRARQPENCGRCHLGPDHPQKEIYEESKHGIAYRDLKDQMNLDADSWVLGKDYSAAPTCATCHMSATRNQPITHDPGKRISWTNRPPVSLLLDTDKDHKIVTETDPAKRAAMIDMSWKQKRENMKDVCQNCHTPDYVENFYRQYDDLIILYNEKYGKPGSALMAALKNHGLLTRQDFDEPVEFTWFFLWHHEGRRARHGASMMAPDYTQWHGMYEVAERWYVHFIPEVEEVIAHAKASANATLRAGALECEKLLNDIKGRPEHAYMRRGLSEEELQALDQHYRKTPTKPHSEKGK